MDILAYFAIAMTIVCFLAWTKERSQAKDLKDIRSKVQARDLILQRIASKRMLYTRHPEYRQTCREKQNILRM